MHDFTPNPKGARHSRESLSEGMQLATPVPQYAQIELPADRSDDSRDAAATGV